jgi:hypothetical protein
MLSKAIQIKVRVEIVPKNKVEKLSGSRRPLVRR